MCNRARMTSEPESLWRSTAKLFGERPRDNGVDRRRKRDPALSKANTCNLSESVGYERIPIGADPQYRR